MTQASATELSAPVLALLETLGIKTRVFDHAPVFTVTESQALRGAIAGAHSKNLFVKDKKGRLFLITALEDARLDLKRLHEAIGAQGRVSFASAEQLRSHLGIEPGSVTPFAVMNDRAGLVTMVLQEALMRHEVQNFHPLTNQRTCTIQSADLVRFLQATGHSPQIVALPEVAPEPSGE